MPFQPQLKKLNFDLNQFLKAISFSLDFVEIDILGSTANHSRRVAYISNRISKKMKLNSATQTDITAFSLLHDNGLSEEALHTDLDIEKLNKLQRMEGLKEHCSFGQRNVFDYPFNNTKDQIIKYHHENFDGTGFFHLKGNEIPISAQIISLADFVDNFIKFNIKNRRKINDFINQNENKRFSKDLVTVFTELSNQTKFWLDLEDQFVIQALDEISLPLNLELTWKEIFEITKVFTNIVDSKSKFTARHTSGLIQKAQKAAEFYNYNIEEKYKLVIAASLHDLGKLAISKNILEKNGRLTVTEMNKMKSHVYYTKVALKQMKIFNAIKEWAANHHEKLNGKGYPEGLDRTQLDFNSRLMSCLDIFQALTEKRPYRRPSPYNEVKKIMLNMSKKDFIDSEITTQVLEFLSF